MIIRLGVRVQVRDWYGRPGPGHGPPACHGHASDLLAASVSGRARAARTATPAIQKL